MAIFPQLLLDVHDELIVDLFAGGGGASVGIEMALGRSPDIAINHDRAAVAMHRANHPQTEHYTSDVFEVCPREVTKGRPVGLLWASPDCTYHSKARGGKPIRSATRKRRALAWVVTRWAGQVKPRVIKLENVEEFLQWGPLVAKRDPETGRVLKSVEVIDPETGEPKIEIKVAEPGERVPVEQQQLVPDPRRASAVFRQWVCSLEAHGYRVEWRERRACDAGAPTIRKRLYVIARCDGEPIVWPEPTHGPGTKQPYRTAAECIDWSIPMLSIFATREEAKAWARALRKAGVEIGTPVRPLAEATLRRIARGVMRYVAQSAEPFVVSLAHGESSGRREYSMDAPIGTQHSGGNKFAVVAPYLVPRYGERDGQEPRTRSIEEPSPAIVPTGNGAQLVSAFLAKHFGGVVGSDLRDPKGTVTTIDHDSLVAAHLMHQYTSNTAGGDGDVERPARTVTTGGHHALIYSFLQAYYGTHQGGGLEDPLATITTRDRFGLVTVIVQGQPYYIADIAMRMLQPRELYNAQGFPRDYRINVRFYDEEQLRWRWLTKTEQVRMVGNSVSPQEACALVRANLPEMVVRDEVAVA